MLRSVFSGTILVVEGATDMRLFGKLTDEDNCEVVAAHSKDNVRLAVRELYNRRKDSKVIGIMDADMDRLKGTVSKGPIFMTDTRDAEMMLMKCSALEDVLWEYAERDALENFTEKYGEVRDIILSSSYPLGLLMYISYIRDYGLSFKDLDFAKFINPITLGIDIKNMIEEVMYNSRDPGAGLKAIRAELEKEMDEEHDPWIVCRGHDAVQILLTGFRRIFGGYNARNMRCGELAGALRLAYDMKDFVNTSLYKETKEWCESKGMKIWVTEPDLP